MFSFIFLICCCFCWLHGGLGRYLQFCHSCTNIPCTTLFFFTTLRLLLIGKYTMVLTLFSLHWCVNTRNPSMQLFFCQNEFRTTLKFKISATKPVALFFARVRVWVALISTCFFFSNLWSQKKIYVWILFFFYMCEVYGWQSKLPTPSSTFWFYKFFTVLADIAIFLPTFIKIIVHADLLHLCIKCWIIDSLFHWNVPSAEWKSS